MMKNYNKHSQKYRFKQWDIDNPSNISITYYDKKTRDVIIQDYKVGNLKFINYNYKPYLLWSLLWSIYKAYRPIKKLDKQSKRHITIVILMIVGILVALYIAYMQGVFDKGL